MDEIPGYFESRDFQNIKGFFNGKRKTTVI